MSKPSDPISRITVIEVAEILKDDANELAILLSDKAFDAMNYRVAKAVRLEMNRLRRFENELLSAVTPEDQK